MICRVQENEGANTICLKANLRSCSLLHLRLLPHLFSILLLFPSFLFLFFPPLPPLSASFYHSSSPSSSSSHYSFSSSFSSSSFYEIRLGYQIYYFKNHFYSASTITLPSLHGYCAGIYTPKHHMQMRISPT